MKYLRLLFFVFCFFNKIYALPYYRRCIALYKTHKAIPCTNQRINKQYEAMCKKLKLSKKPDLFIAKNIIAGNQQAAALYNINNQAIITNQTIWQTLSHLTEKFILFHELRHVMQISEKNKSAWKNIYTLTIKKQLTFEQALEYDADQFAIAQAAQKCPTCLRLLKKTAEIKKTKNYEGYFIQKDFNPIIKKTLLNPRYCSDHKK